MFSFNACWMNTRKCQDKLTWENQTGEKYIPFSLSGEYRSWPKKSPSATQVKSNDYFWQNSDNYTPQKYMLNSTNTGISHDPYEEENWSMEACFMYWSKSQGATQNWSVIAIYKPTITSEKWPQINTAHCFKNVRYIVTLDAERLTNTKSSSGNRWNMYVAKSRSI